ncbi:hypothetical protein BOX15_Mlig030933g1, partial [Macrostomum lignano]
KGEATEDYISNKTDRCLSDTAIKTVSGLGIGILCSVLFLRRRPWPAVLGTGIGLGMGVANCDNDFKTPHSLVSQQIRVAQRQNDPLLGSK